MGAKKSVQDLRTREEREAAKRDFEVLMRQAAMEFDASYSSMHSSRGGGGVMRWVRRASVY